MIKMQKERSFKDVYDEKLVPFYEKKGWVIVDAPESPVRAALKPTKKFTEVVESDESETVDETPAATEASVENAIEQGD